MRHEKAPTPFRIITERGIEERLLPGQCGTEVPINVPIISVISHTPSSLPTHLNGEALQNYLNTLDPELAEKLRNPGK